MGLTSIDFSQIENIDNTPTGININKAIRFNNQLQISNIPPSQENTSNIWFNKTTEELKIRINNTTYDLQPSSTLNSISISSNTTINLGGKRGIINNLTVTGTNTILTVRTGSLDWSILEVQGDLTIASGCTLNLIRTPLIVRGSILGNGNIISPDGVNGGTGGVGGPGGSGGAFGTPGGVSLTLSSPGWTNGVGGSAITLPMEYGISSGKGGNGGRGTGGGGGGGFGNGGASGVGSNPSYSGGSGSIYIWGGGGGGAGGVGQNGTGDYDNNGNGGIGGPGAWANPGESGNSAGTLSIPYIGISTPSSAVTASSQGTPGGSTFGGAGGQGAYYNYEDLPTIGSPGGNGGNGGPGGSTGGAHLAVFCIGDISSNISFKPGKGGINGGISNGLKAQTGSIWLFNKYGTTALSTPGSYDISGIGPSPFGPIGSVTRILVTDSTSVNNFFRDILYNTNGSTPAKDVITLTL